VGARGRFRAGVEGLRAVAILAVVLYHAGLGAAGGGYLGVDIFYVLSGFLITGLLWGELGHTGRLSFALFYARRARRLLPAAMLVVATMVALLAALPAAVVLPPLVGLAGLVLILAAPAEPAAWGLAVATQVLFAVFGDLADVVVLPAHRQLGDIRHHA
jgi:peptidoglycan/LPS O-acetylase OafA/YrhL